MNSKTTLYLVRHGQTEWNVLHKMQGHQDSSLTALGIKQAQWLSDALKDMQIEVICSSTSLRARNTAEIIRRDRKVEIEECDEFREINLGVWEGKTQSEAKEDYPEAFDQFWNRPDNFLVEGSETFNEVLTRAHSKLKQIMTSNQGKSILLVTHTVVVKVLMAYFEGRPMNEIWNPPYIHPACLCKVEIDPSGVNIILHGDTSHYQEKPSMD
ncbi:histidine phosphatase family protein [Paenibacillus sp. 1001270B_150601_E10]|uniref:histidine phosphatase family protein n=1 Tax=Paenibacillus sp. 1001270B_150601_E10 TaxID=2787079 RepID=UPI00189D065F|nr:histidine phosphatase family protein [Paenibacillus sp. 1001270B_150601_E10]